MQQLATRSIDLGRSLAFAALSGDFNPLHCDPVRRGGRCFAAASFTACMPAPRPRCMCAAGLPSSRSIPGSTPSSRSRYRLGPHSRSNAPRSRKARFGSCSPSRGARAQTIRWNSVPQRKSRARLVAARHAKAAARDLTFAEAAAANGASALALGRELYSREIPALAGAGPGRLVAVILAATRIVGMECPGQNSVFSGLSQSAPIRTRRASLGCAIASYRPRSVCRRSRSASKGSG